MPSLTFLEPAFTVESTLFSPFSRSDFPLSRQGAAFAHLDSLPPHNSMLWTDRSVPFRFGKGGSGVLANFPFQQAQDVLVFPLKPAPFCILFTGLGSTNKSAISYLFYLTRSILATLSFPPSFPLSQTFWQIWQELSSLSSCSIRLQWVRGYLFLSRLMSWLDGERYLRPLQSLVVSHFSYPLFSFLALEAYCLI